MFRFKLYQGAGMGERSVRTYTREDPCFFQIIVIHWGTRNSIVSNNWRCVTDHPQHSATTRIYRYGIETAVWKIVREEHV
jgi:hypothetical protein